MVASSLHCRRLRRLYPVTFGSHPGWLSQWLCGVFAVSIVACTGDDHNIEQRFSPIETTEVVAASAASTDSTPPLDETHAAPMTALAEGEQQTPQMISYSPMNPGEDMLSRDVFGKVRQLVADDWHPDAALFKHAFDRLTPTGMSIFEATYSFVAQQKDEEFQDYAQPLQCATNVSYVLAQAGYQIHGDAIYSIPYLIQGIKDAGGEIYELPTYHDGHEYSAELIEFLNQHFAGGIPTGAIIVGCKNRNCLGSELSGGHIGILGDKNEFGDLMIYHNNWYRPNHQRGVRMPYMVSLENMYALLRPREWMATPWLSFNRNSAGYITAITTAAAFIDDFYVYGGDYHIKIVLLPALVQELKTGATMPAHRNISSGNIHRNIHPKEADWMVCRSKEPLQTIGARYAPYGELNVEVLHELSGYNQVTSMLHERFEFAILEEQDEWVSALIYDQDRFWGSNDIYGALWLHKSKVQCWQKDEIFLHRQRPS